MPLEPVEEQIARAKLIQHFVKAMAIASKAFHNDDSYVAYVALRIVVGIIVPNAGPESCAEVFEEVLKEELEDPLFSDLDREKEPQ